MKIKTISMFSTFILVRFSMCYEESYRQQFEENTAGGGVVYYVAHNILSSYSR